MPRPSVAVTGASGFVGSHLVDVLVTRGYEVACLLRSEKALGTSLDRCSVHIGDLADTAAIDALLEGREIAFHVAGATTGRGRPEELLPTNRDGTARLADRARRAGVRRVVYVSTISVSGPSSRGQPLAEAGPPAPVTPYGHSKAAGEEALRASGVPFTILRPVGVYGPQDRAFFPLFRMARHGFLPVFCDGGQEHALIHARDLASALIAAAGHDRAAGRTYHVVGPEILTQRELAVEIGEALGRRVRPVPVPKPLVIPILLTLGGLGRITGRRSALTVEKAPEFLAPAWTASNDALTADTGWRPEIPLRDGLAEVAAWYHEAGWL